MSIDPVSTPSARAVLRSDDVNAPRTRPTAAEVAKAAQQFEAIMVRQLLAPSIEPMMNGGLGGESGAGGGVYGYMLTDVLASSIAQGGGLGLSDIIARQLTPATPVAKTP